MKWILIFLMTSGTFNPAVVQKISKEDCMKSLDVINIENKKNDESYKKCIKNNDAIIICMPVYRTLAYCAPGEVKE